MRLWPHNRVADELKITNFYLALIADGIQKEPKPAWLQPVPRVTVNVPKQTVNLPQPLTDASELLARWLWLQLPEESKKDLMP